MCYFAHYTLFGNTDIKKLMTEVITHDVRATGFSFIWELTEDYNQRENLPDSSEELLRLGGVGDGRGGGGAGVWEEVHIHVILAKEYVQRSKSDLEDTCDITCMGSKEMAQMNLFTEEKLSQKCRKQACNCQRGK